MKKILIIVPDGGMLFESAGIADILMQANRLHPEGTREICYQVKLALRRCDAAGANWTA